MTSHRSFKFKAEPLSHFDDVTQELLV